MAHPRPLLWGSRMHGDQESGDSSDGSSRGCNCGDCLVGGCSCTDTGSHDECLCGRCGDGSDDTYKDRKQYYE